MLAERAKIACYKTERKKGPLSYWTRSQRLYDNAQSTMPRQLDCIRCRAEGRAPGATQGPKGLRRTTGLQSTGAILTMNRSAKDGAWSSPHYGGEGTWVPLRRTKVFAGDTVGKSVSDLGRPGIVQRIGMAGMVRHSQTKGRATGNAKPCLKPSDGRYGYKRKRSSGRCGARSRIGASFRSWNGRAKVEPRAGCRYGDRSTSLWFGASNAWRTCADRGRCRRPTWTRGAHIAAWSGASFGVLETSTRLACD